MGWAQHYIEKLQRGETIQFRPRGNSMQPKVPDGALVTVEPVDNKMDILVDDVVLCRVKGKDYLHRVESAEDDQSRFLIGNMRGFTNGWTPRKNVFGRVTKVEP